MNQEGRQWVGGDPQRSPSCLQRSPGFMQQRSPGYLQQCSPISPAVPGSPIDRIAPVPSATRWPSGYNPLE